MTEAHIGLHFMFTTVHPPEYEFVAARGLKKTISLLPKLELIVVQCKNS